MVKYEFWVWCSDCKVFMELGNYKHHDGHFDGPFVSLTKQRTGDDWALRRFLEEHTGHRVGLEQDVNLRFDDCPIKSDWKHIQPLTEYCMVFSGLDEAMEKVSFPAAFRKVLFIVDVYDWAWDIASTELLRHWPGVEGRIISIQDFFDEDVNAYEYDVVFVYPWGSKQLMDKLDPRRTVVCVAGGEQVKMEAALRYNCSKFKFFGACNETLRETLQGWFPKRSVVVLSHGVETDTFKPQPIPHEGFVVGWAGSMKRSIKRFPKAQQIAREADVALNVAGYKDDGTNKPHSEMPYYYNSCDLFLVTSEFEAHPMVVYEAMSCGIPVVATSVGDLPENIVDGYNGILLDVEAPVSAFVEKIMLLRESPGMRRKMSVRARNTILQKWSWDKIAGQYRALGVTMNDP